MIKLCAWHPGNPNFFVAEVEPLENKGTTHGLCVGCAERVNAEIDKMSFAPCVDLRTEKNNG